MRPNGRTTLRQAMSIAVALRHPRARAHPGRSLHSLPEIFFHSCREHPVKPAAPMAPAHTPAPDRPSFSDCIRCERSVGIDFGSRSVSSGRRNRPASRLVFPHTVISSLRPGSQPRLAERSTSAAIARSMSGGGAWSGLRGKAARRISHVMRRSRYMPPLTDRHTNFRRDCDRRHRRCEERSDERSGSALGYGSLRSRATTIAISPTRGQRALDHSTPTRRTPRCPSSSRSSAEARSSIE